jgi:enoyl-CoA hydratase/carnithine racemase
MPMLPALNVLFRFKFRDYSVFQKVLLKGHKFNAEEALADGLVDAVTSIDRLLEKAIELGELYGSNLEIGGDIYSDLRTDYLKELIKALEKNDIGEYYSKL